jgi:Tfp pilus assembly protein PilV
VAINASGNVSSITDNGVGDYTVNFTTAMSDANYSAAMIGTWDVTISTDQYFCGIRASSKTPTTKTTAALRLISGQSSTSAVDSQNQSVAIFR